MSRSCIRCLIKNEKQNENEIFFLPYHTFSYLFSPLTRGNRRRHSPKAFVALPHSCFAHSSPLFPFLNFSYLQTTLSLLDVQFLIPKEPRCGVWAIAYCTEVVNESGMDFVSVEGRKSNVVGVGGDGHRHSFHLLFFSEG